MIKPRIRRIGGGVWGYHFQCVGGGFWGTGYSPGGAYAAWKRAIENKPAWANILELRK